MLSEQDNRTVSRVGPGTPMGELMRRFWIPALLSSEVGAPDGAPVRQRILGEDLLAFRDTQGRVGVVDAYCAHRLAPLYWGRNEDCGIRCVYHGWKYDVTGQCVDMPNEPESSSFKDKVRIAAYPTREKGGVVWIYMGPRELQPELPRLECAEVPDSHRVLRSWLHESNWLQGLEGEIDTSHVSFLHRYFDREQVSTGFNQQFMQEDSRPRLTVHETPYGFVYGSRRTAGDAYYWRLTQWLIPFYALIPGTPPNTGRAWVPVDDEHTKVIQFRFRSDRPLDSQDLLVNSPERGRRRDTRTERCVYRLPDGTPIDVDRPIVNRDNDFQVSRDMQRLHSFSGIPGSAADEDRAMTIGMRPIVNRSREHLGTTDIAIIAARRRLLRLVRDLERGQEPEAARDADGYAVRALEVTEREPDFDTLLPTVREAMAVGGGPQPSAR
ncbi:MAG: Rieske 2Fe-2S domain-containing protein [Candidatus Dormibacteraeota bacterium]|nr:Rieske 2Fe-2S domain-containing protein [Candidatus Dormibacteraeota bacterium]MBO0760614.1 Rieske 2Fe-2S domain-containing protein [Candidatus Dormibacteraeota bacterium]